MENNLDKKIFNVIISLNLLNVISIFLPVFVCNSSKNIAEADKSISIIKLLDNILNKKIIDIQIITFVIIFLILSFISLIFALSVLGGLRKSKANKKECLFSSILIFLFSFVIMVFVIAICQQSNLLNLISVQGVGTYTAGISVYLIMLSSVLQLILALILKKV